MTSTTIAARNRGARPVAAGTVCNRSAGLLSALFYSAFPSVSQAASGIEAAEPTTIHVLRTRTSYDHTASKFTYYTNYTCFFSKYWMTTAEPEPMRSQLAKQRALKSAPPVSRYSGADEGEVEEYFAPGRYARYQRSITFAPVKGVECALEEVHETKIQIAQGARLINVTSKNGHTTINETALQPTRQPTAQDSQRAQAVLTPLAETWGNGFATGTVSKVGERTVAGERCDVMSSSGSTFGIGTDLCVWRGIKTFQTPLGPKEIVLFSETRAPPGAQPMRVTDPLELNTAEILHWTEQAKEFHVNETFTDAVFTPPRSAP